MNITNMILIESDGYDIAYEKAVKDINILAYIYSDDDYEIIYSSFYFLNCKTIDIFTNDLITIVSKEIKKMNSKNVKIEFTEMFTQNSIYLEMDGWKRMKVENIDEKLNIIEYETYIVNIFEKKFVCT
jgi:hypothetical protein